MRTAKKDCPRVTDIATFVRRENRQRSVDVDVATDLPEQRQSRHAGCVGENDTFTVEFVSSTASRLARFDPLNWSRKDFISGRDRARSPRARRVSLFLSLSLSFSGQEGSRFEKPSGEISSAYSGRHYRETAASSSAVWPFTAVRVLLLAVIPRRSVAR